MIADTNKIIRAYLITQTVLTSLIGGADPRIYCPRLPEKAVLPAISFFTRGGLSTPHIPGIPEPSVQFDCWAEDIVGGLTGAQGARRIYRALYDSLQGIENVSVASPARVIGIDGDDYDCIKAHTANERNKPVTGALRADYWLATGSSGFGSAWVSGSSYRPSYEIMSAIEEVQGQDLVDVDIPTYFRTLAFFRVMIRAE